MWVALMKARIKWVQDRTFIGESGSVHKIVFGTAFGPAQPIDDLFADPNFAAEAVYLPESGEPISVRLLARRPDRELEFGDMLPVQVCASRLHSAQHDGSHVSLIR